MTRPDLNLLVTLDVLLAELSVARAAERLRLSPSAMSRALQRLRDTTGDPLLVRAGRGLVPTPRALELAAQVRGLVDQGEAVLRPQALLDLGRLERTFTLRTSDGFVENFGAALVTRAAREAPRVKLRFVSKLDKDSAPLRDGLVDLETGVVSKTSGPELRVQALFRDRSVGVVRVGHPLLTETVTPERLASVPHVVVSRRGDARSRSDDALEALGLHRDVTTIVGGFATALALARLTDLMATVPERHTGNLRAGMVAFDLPYDLPEIIVSMLWHPRMDADPGHRWLRGCVKTACA